VVLLLLTCLPSLVTAREWSVERHGSGDFEIIQDGLDQANSGDIIRIGRASFFEWEERGRIRAAAHGYRDLQRAGHGRERDF